MADESEFPPLRFRPIYSLKMQKGYLKRELKNGK
jgi:hypothetical protein